MEGRFMNQPFNFLAMQQAQFKHDQRNHSDIVCLPKPDRLKHYGLHFAKYVGRFARGDDELISKNRTLVDMLLVCLSTANCLHQHLDKSDVRSLASHEKKYDSLRTIADAAGRFADACEKIDHMEDFLTIARNANIDVLNWTLDCASECGLDINEAIIQRRKELVARQFYIAE